MAKKSSLEAQVEGWRNFGLLLLLVLGVVGAISYSLIVRQKTRLDMQDQRIVQLTDSVNKLEGKAGTGSTLRKR